MDRPTGVTLIAILGFIVGGLHFIGSFLAFASGSWLQAEAVSGYFVPAATGFVYSFGNLGFWIGMLGMIVAVIMLVAAGGLWVLSKFGWKLTIIALVLNLSSTSSTGSAAPSPSPACWVRSWRSAC